MLMKASRQTVSIVHQNAAQYHYDLAMQAWDTYIHCLDDRGLIHPDFVRTVKKSLSEYWRHSRIADGLMRLNSAFFISRRYRARTKGFAREFEQAVIQRGENAKAAANLPTVVDGELM